MSLQTSLFKEKFQTYLPFLIAILFLISASYLSLYHHPFWFNDDGVLYFWWGDQILSGNGDNVEIFHSPPGGSLVHATLNNLIQDPFLTGKIISIFSGFGIILLSFYITNNFFSRKVALLTQLFFVFNPRILLLSIDAVNELLPIFFIMASFYFITKKELTTRDIILSTFFLGISSMLRSQALPLFFGLIIYLLIREKHNFSKFKYPILCVIIFFLTLSPLMFYNYTTHGILLEGNSDLYALMYYEYQTPEWRHEVQENLVSEHREFQASMFADFGLFLQNYFYNMLFHHPNLLFNFNTLSNISLISAVPFLSIIPIFGGFLYALKFNMNKSNILLLSVSLIFSLVAIAIFGDFATHSFALLIIPMIIIGFFNFKNISKPFSALIILAFVYWIIISITRLGQPYQLLPMWIVPSILASLFLIEFLPNIKNKKKSFHYIALILIILILITQTLFAYKFLETHLYSSDILETVAVEQYDLQKILNSFSSNSFSPRGSEYMEVGSFLAAQPNIQDSYVMTRWLPIAYYADSKFVYSLFTEGKSGDDLNTFVSRKNWSELELYVSNRYSNPSDRHNILSPIPDYLVYKKLSERHYSSNHNQTQTFDLMVLADPHNPSIPQNFELIYTSKNGEFFVYRIR